MMFKTGNLLKNKVNSGLWLVEGVYPHKGPKFKLRLDAICIQPGISRINYPGSHDSWFCRQEDGSDRYNVWEVINEV